MQEKRVHLEVTSGKMFKLWIVTLKKGEREGGEEGSQHAVRLIL